jgi:hypothetical protein
MWAGGPPRFTANGGSSASPSRNAQVARSLRPRRRRGDPKQRWLAFLANYREALVAMDFLTVCWQEGQKLSGVRVPSVRGTGDCGLGPGCKDSGEIGTALQFLGSGSPIPHNGLGWPASRWGKARCGLFPAPNLNAGDDSGQFTRAGSMAQAAVPANGTVSRFLVGENV